ncbi:MAG: serine/threonine protein kinase [Anaerolineae bacterium]|nr:serine/threonine protein kinase [Phycisphaerae bacterium]
MSTGPIDNAQPDARAYGPDELANIMAAVRDSPRLQQIGPYHVEELIGEGGMGSVYRAEQREPIRRTVAIKVIKLGMDTRQVIARFESERQTLAIMDHPNVATVLDAGATESGRPYFIMEYVHGEPITSFADREKLSLDRRLQLFTQACDAVQHAHQKAIIHRDIKPSNILVTLKDGKPWVKVIDFGVAKAIDQRVTEKSLFTEAGQLIGTPEYMAPEQADGNALDVDTRTDVYALGVVLYELLIGVLPFDPTTLRSAGYREIQRIIREVDPPRPSARLSALGETAIETALLRCTQLTVLHQQLKRELEWIPLKAMRKERAERYSSVRELAEDIDNYLANRPLRAGPESRTYRARKFLRRNKTGVAASAAMVFLLISGIIATSRQAIRATRAERQALVEKRQAEEAREATTEVNTFLVDMFGSVDPKVAQGKQMLVKDVLDGAARTLPTKFKTQPRIESAIRSALGRTYLALGLYEQSEEQLSRALEIDLRQLGPDDPQTLTSRQHFGLVRRHRGDYEQAQAIYQETLERRRRVQGEDHPDTLGSLGDVAVILDLLGAPEAEGAYRQARDRSVQVRGRDDLRTLLITGNLGQLLQRVGKYEEAEQLLRECYDGRLQALGPDYPDTIAISSALAYVMRSTGKGDESETMMRDALERSQRVNGEHHARTIFTENGLAQVLCDRQKFEEGVKRYQHAVAQAREHLGLDNPNTATLMQAAATAMNNAGRASEAEPLMREALAEITRLRGPDHPHTITAQQNLCGVLQRLERWEEALPLAESGYARLREPGRVQIQPARRAGYLAMYGTCLWKLGRHQEAYEPLIVALDALRQANGSNRPLQSRVLQALAEVCETTQRPEEAAKWRAESAALTASTRPTTGPSTLPATRSAG